MNEDIAAVENEALPVKHVHLGLDDVLYSLVNRV